MSTNARIGIDNGDNTVTSIYTHWDGYPTHHAPILAEHYRTEQHLRQLLALGDVSILDAAIGEQHDFDMHSEERAKLGPWTVFYGRDRGETDVDAVTHPIDQWPDYGQSYEYLLRADGNWYGREMAYDRAEDGSYSKKPDSERPWIPLSELFDRGRRESIYYLQGELEHPDRARSAEQEIARLEAITLV